MEFSIVIPVYNEEKSIQELQRRIDDVFRSINKEREFEIIFVDDGSTDESREILKQLSSDKAHVKYIFLRKRSGKSFALSAGFLHAKGDMIVTMDGDLQDRPEEIPVLISKLNDGYDLVSGWKQKRKDNSIRVLGSWIFNKVVSVVGGVRLHDFNCGLKIYRKEVVKRISVYGQYHRFIPLLAHFIGFKIGEVHVKNDSRKFGRSRYATFRYEGFFDLLSILFVYKYRFSPLYFFGIVSLVFMVPSLLVLSHFVFRIFLWVLNIIPNPSITFDRPILALSLSMFSMGFNMFLIGLVCEFILHHQVKRAVVESIENFVDESNCE